MSSTPSTPQSSKSKVIWFALVVVIIFTISILWLFRPQPVAATAQASENTSTAVSSAPVPSATTPAITTAIVAQQTAAVTAVAQETHAKPIVDKVNVRPDFVSEVEWQTLKMIAQKNPNPDQELTRLVSNMRFNKQMDVWQNLPHTTDRTQRDALATQLLADIPTAVNNQAIDKTEAQKAQITLINDLESDPTIRQQRIAQETARIGMKFDIQESRS